MQRERLVTAVAVGLMCVAAADAAALANKTVEIGWTSSGSGRRVGDSRTIAWNTSHHGTVYVSSAGRVFMRRSFATLGRGGGSETTERGPDQSSSRGSVRLEGSRIVGTAVQPSGAVRFVVSFDPTFTSCALQVTYGRAGGQMQVRGPGGGTFEVDAITAGQPTCTVRDGNGL